MTATARVRAAAHACANSVRVFVRDVGSGLLDVSHNSLALIGLCVVAALVFTTGRDDLRLTAEQHMLGWLQARNEARQPPETPIQAMAEPTAVERATAADPKELNRQQAAVANWLARRYKVAPEPLSRLVQEAWSVGKLSGLDPTLILAVMAIESRFNPFAQSPVGAQGLMQVMTQIHDDKYEAFGGIRAAFDPVTNLRVGVLVLKECIARAGSIEAGLRYYVGAANLDSDGGYAVKVLSEQSHLRSVVSGKAVAITVPQFAPAVGNALRTESPAPTPQAPTEAAEPMALAVPAAPTPRS